MTPKAVTIKLSDDSKRYLAFLKQQLGKSELYKTVLEFFDKRAKGVLRRITRDALSGNAGLRVRTGALRRSIEGRSELVRGVPALRVGVFRGPSLQYAGVQHEGTKGENPDSPYPTIVPKKGKALAIPTGPALTRAGVARYRGPRDYERATGRMLRFVPFKASSTAIGGLFDFSRRRGAERNLEQAKLAYVLLRKVDITPKFFIRNPFLAELPDIGSQLAKLIVLRLRRAV